jgi:hypothetical protein
MPADSVCDSFGEHFLMEYGFEVPQKLIDKWIKLNDQMMELEDELQRYMKNNDE